MSLAVAIVLGITVIVIALIIGAYFDSKNNNQQPAAGPSTWDMLSSRRKNRHIAVANIDGGDPAARLEAFVTEGLQKTTWCRVVPGQQGEGYMLTDLQVAMQTVISDLAAHEDV